MANSVMVNQQFSVGSWLIIHESEARSELATVKTIVAGSFKSQLIDYFRGAITSWDLVEGSLWQFYDNET